MTIAVDWDIKPQIKQKIFIIITHIITITTIIIPSTSSLSNLTYSKMLHSPYHVQYFYVLHSSPIRIQIQDSILAEWKTVWIYLFILLINVDNCWHFNIYKQDNIFMPPKELWEANSNRTVSPSVRPAFVSGPYLLYSLR